MRIVNISPVIREQYQNKLEEVLNLCRNRQKTTPIPTPKLVFSQMGQKAGLCHYDHITKICILYINPDYITNHADDMLNRTLPHEVAHYVAIQVFGRGASGHGMFWKMVMGWVGLPSAHRCHSYSTEGVKLRRVNKPHRYVCGCVGDDSVHMMTPRAHVGIQMGHRWFTCKRCYQRLKYSPNVPTTPPVIMVPRVSVVVPPPVVEVKPIVNDVEPKYKLVTKFINGSLTNVRELVTA